MTRYSVEIVQKAEKEYSKLPESVKHRLQELILSLDGAEADGCKETEGNRLL